MVVCYWSINPQGDFILEDGQHFRIGYIYYGGGFGNVIVYIEALP